MYKEREIDENLSKHEKVSFPKKKKNGEVCGSSKAKKFVWVGGVVCFLNLHICS